MIEQEISQRTKKKEALRKKLRNDVMKFLNSGGQVNIVENGHSGMPEKPKFNSSILDA